MSFEERQTWDVASSFQALVKLEGKIMGDYLALAGVSLLPQECSWIHAGTLVERIRENQRTWEEICKTTTQVNQTTEKGGE